MAGVDYCTVLPSWDFDKDPAVVVEYYFGQEPSSQTDDINAETGPPFCQDLNPQNCLTLNRVEGEEEACTVTLTCKPQYHVSICGLHVYSQAGLMEIYDASEGYLKTVRGQRVRVMGDDEGGEETEVVYRCRSSLDTCYGLTIKFPRLRGTSTLKIYKIVFILHPEPEDEYSRNGGEIGQINMSKVRSYVTSLGDNLPEGARGLMQSMEEFQQNQRSSMSGLSSLLGQRPMSAGSPLGMMGLMSMFSQIGVKSSQLPNRPSNSQSNSSNSGIQGATANPPSSSNSQESADVFSLLHNICDKVSVMREDDKRKAKERDEARREENGTAAEQPDLGNTQMNNNNRNSVEEIRSEDIDISVGSPNILDTKLEALEQRLLNHIDLKISEMETRINSKLDDILHQLSRKSTTETES